MHAHLPRPGSVVWIRRQRWRIERVRLDHGLIRFEVTDRRRRRTFLAPFDRPVSAGRAGRVRWVRSSQALARLAGLAARAGGLRTPLSALTADIALLPHQFDPLIAFLDGRRRVLVADDVGLGKTIQAGLVIADLMTREPAPFMLVLVPATIRAQWADELQRRFALSAAPADRLGLAQATRTGARGDNPWQHARIWIASLDFLKQPHVIRSLPMAFWDLVIVDEAHDACGDSERHAACETLLSRARRVLLLTATPHSGDPVRFRRLQQLGALPDADDALVMFRRTRADLGWPASRRVRWTTVRLSSAETAVLDALIAFERRALAAAGEGRRDAALLLLAVLRKRALSTMAALGRSLARRLAWLDATGADEPVGWTQPRLVFDLDHEADDFTADDHAALAGRIGMDPRTERSWLERLRTLATRAVPHDSKIRHLRGLLSRSSEPAVLFTEFRDSLIALRDRLAQYRVVAVLHGSQTARERTGELLRFLDGRASLLVATDVAGQGLNLQSRARWVMSLELPWNPARIAQRVGRVDRIGQTRPVHASLLVAGHEAERGILRHLSARALTAAREVGASGLEAVIPPDHLAVAATLIDGRPAPPAAACELPASPPPSRGRAVVRLLERKRRLAERWPPQVEHHRPFAAVVNGLPSGAGRAVAIVRVPLVDANGAELEAHFLGLALDVPPGPGGPEFSAALRQVAHHRLRARIARLRRLHEAQIQRRDEIDRALARHLQSTLAPTLQPGLFATRIVAANTAEWLARGARSATPDLDIVVGDPAVEALLYRRPVR